MENLFNSDNDRNLWIRLNAERQIEWEKTLTYFNIKTGKHEPTLQALNPRTMVEALRVSKNQLERDEEKGVLRYSLEELLTLTIEELTEKDNKKHKEWIENFKKI